jgi:hypothetical protein
MGYGVLRNRAIRVLLNNFSTKPQRSLTPLHDDSRIPSENRDPINRADREHPVNSACSSTQCIFRKREL